MDKNESSAPRRKGRFKPKAQPRKPKPTVLTTEVEDAEKEEREAKALLRKFQEKQARRAPKAEKKSTVQVAFGPGAASSSSLRTYGVPKVENLDQGSSLGVKGSDNDQILSPSPLATSGAGTDAPMDIDIADASISNVKNQYIEIWDYENSKYPTTLPLRKPYSGDPDILNEKEFVEDAAKEYDESTINCASELGLLEQNAKEKLLFVQLPPTLPLVKRPTSAKGKERVGSSAPSEKVGAANKGGSLEELSEGYMGKMLVYKSGAVKFKLGDALYDVSPGSDCIFAQDVAAINTAARKCCVLGELGQRVVITPDVDSLLDATIELD
ncbi:putative DNA-directed RNA polymerase III subunit RPC4 [Rosa chinensis]|uniref:Putative DNA-directed RNA polymerase III subunit RPC4 n=1 Tax=Rosa chinensis TaxID=74649 RepID=A0A2P6SM61_ROSCH|nr:DNA-directed RNA polymerase III subunit rpc4 [Rosa chinensis]PRQ59785.1 putative DNA-directed RNA polymerase III subunit RPC4 [Rosa chinensis]